MDLARVYVGPLVSVLVPFGWSAWTWQGTAFKREHGAVWQECDPGVWMLPDTSVTRTYMCAAKAVDLRVFDSEICGRVGASQAPPSADSPLTRPADEARRSC